MPKFDDSHYKHIVSGNFPGFWKLHDHFQFSENFKDFILSMFCDSASLRLSISEIRNHPWMLEEVATKEEVLAEMS